MNADTRAFLSGYKPSVGLIRAFDQEDFELLESKGFPSHPLNETMTLFFQDEFTKGWFESNCDFSIYDHNFVGLTLGFPPEACKHFTNKTPGILLERISCKYGGIRFMSYERCIIGDLTWLRDVRPLPIGEGLVIELDFSLHCNFEYDYNPILKYNIDENNGYNNYDEFLEGIASKLSLLELA